jgi:hypothetical protein
MRLIVLQRWAMDSPLSQEECVQRLRDESRRVRLPFKRRRPFVGRVTTDGFLLAWHGRMLRASASSLHRARVRIVSGRAAGSELHVEAGMAAVRTIVVGSTTALACAFILSGIEYSVPAVGHVTPAIAVLIVLAYTFLGLRWWNGHVRRLIQQLSAVCQAEMRARTSP